MTKFSRVEWLLLSMITLAAALWLGEHYTGFLPDFARGVLTVASGWTLGDKLIGPMVRDWRDQ